MTQADTDAVFDALDDDKSGQLEYKELNVMLRKGAGSELTKANLKRMQSKQADRAASAKVTRKNLDSNYVTVRVRPLCRQPSSSRTRMATSRFPSRSRTSSPITRSS